EHKLHLDLVQFFPISLQEFDLGRRPSITEKDLGGLVFLDGLQGSLVLEAVEDNKQRFPAGDLQPGEPDDVADLLETRAEPIPVFHWRHVEDARPGSGEEDLEQSEKHQQRLSIEGGGVDRDGLYRLPIERFPREDGSKRLKLDARSEETALGGLNLVTLCSQSRPQVVISRTFGRGAFWVQDLLVEIDHSDNRLVGLRETTDDRRGSRFEAVGDQKQIVWFSLNDGLQ